MAKKKKHYASYLTMTQSYNLSLACQSLRSFGAGTYLVGSILEKPDYHDVDLRCILFDDEYDRMFGDKKVGRSQLAFLNTAISEWFANRAGLPVDFQFQRMTEANEQFKGPRNGVFFF